MTRPTMAELAGLPGDADSSAQAADRVAAARATAALRLCETPWQLMADVPPEHIRKSWPISARATSVLDSACSGDSMRGRDRVLRVAWTIADLAGHGEPLVDDVAVAHELRSVVQSWAA